MTTAAQQEISRKARIDTLTRVGKYTVIRFIMLFFAVALGIYLTILIANMGGYVDEIRRAEIRENIAIGISMSPEYKKLSTEERKQLQDKLVVLEEDRLGLNQPFIIRSFTYLKDALMLRLGRAMNMTSDSGSRQVKLILLERLPATLLYIWHFFPHQFFRQPLCSPHAVTSLWQFLGSIRRGPGSHFSGARLVLWYFSHRHFRGLAPNIALWRHGGRAAAGGSGPVRPQCGGTYDFALERPGHQFDLPVLLRLVGKEGRACRVQP